MYLKRKQYYSFFQFHFCRSFLWLKDFVTLIALRLTSSVYKFCFLKEKIMILLPRYFVAQTILWTTIFVKFSVQRCVLILSEGILICSSIKCLELCVLRQFYRITKHKQSDKWKINSEQIRRLGILRQKKMKLLSSLTFLSRCRDMGIVPKSLRTQYHVRSFSARNI